MLNDKDIRDRAEYCFYVCFQLKTLLRNEIIESCNYSYYLEKSSLELGCDAFIQNSLQEALKLGKDDAGLENLVYLYEGFFLAFCESLEIAPQDLIKSIPQDFLDKLSYEMKPKP